jgi:hypothetical protein
MSIEIESYAKEADVAYLLDLIEEIKEEVRTNGNR